MRRGKSTLGIGLILAAAVLAGPLPFEVETQAQESTHWFVSFEGIPVPPVMRSDTAQLIDVGSIETDGFRDLVFSLGGEFKELLPRSGNVGVILIPDIEVFQYLLKSEAQFVFPLEAAFDVNGLDQSIFISDQQRAKIAFPRYRVYFYNETTSGASMSLYVYRTR